LGHGGGSAVGDPVVKSLSFDPYLTADADAWELAQADNLVDAMLAQSEHIRDFSKV